MIEYVKMPYRKTQRNVRFSHTTTILKYDVDLSKTKHLRYAKIGFRPNSLAWLIMIPTNYSYFFQGGLALYIIYGV